MHVGYVNYRLFKNQWVCHINFMEQQVESETFDNKEDMQEYVKSKDYVEWHMPEEIGRMRY